MTGPAQGAVGGAATWAQVIRPVTEFRVRAALSVPGAGAEELDDLATFVVAVTQSLAVLSRAGTRNAELRVVVQVACTAVADTLARATAVGA